MRMIKKHKILNGEWLLKNSKIYDSFAKIYIEGDLLIEDGTIKSVNQKISNAKNVINCKGKLICPGFMDLHAHFREPGREDKETLQTGANAAMSGGFTKVCVMPNTNPPLDTPEAIKFIKEKSRFLPIDIYPIGAITINQDGKEIAEYSGMVNEGAVALSDDGIPLQNGQVMRYALEYSSMFDVPIINHAEDIFIRNDGVMNESSLSTKLGLPGNPSISESTMVFRDLELAEYVNGRIHIPHVSSKKSVDLIRFYKEKGVNVTSEATPHHIALNDDLLVSYNTNAKVAPPLRKKEDSMALIDGLNDGTIDCIATDHAPHTIEDKEKDICHAPCGMISLESAFGLSNKALNERNVPIERIIELFTSGPASVLDWKFEPFKVGNKVDLTIIDINKEWNFTEGDIYSRSKNSPVLGMSLLGKVECTIYGENAFGFFK
mgnify:CR=1 FL=1